MGRRGPGRGASSRGRPPPRPRARVRCGFCSPFVFRGVTPRRGSSGRGSAGGAARLGPARVRSALPPGGRRHGTGRRDSAGSPSPPPAPAHTGERPLPAGLPRTPSRATLGSARQKETARAFRRPASHDELPRVRGPAPAPGPRPGFFLRRRIASPAATCD